MNSSDFKLMSDEELVRCCSLSESAFSELIARYSHRIKAKAHSMATPMVDSDDLTQEGLIGLFDAAVNYDSSKDTAFSTYSDACISNRMLSALRAGSRHISAGDGADEEFTSISPESIVIERESGEEISREIMLHLSEMEWRIFRLFLGGASYAAIGAELGASPKSVDNAIQRVRRKLRAVGRSELFK